ncbi:MAG: O-methyltransferase [Ignavibacteria bacterium]|nr:MAG: O-methyltransferase [Ignavibacteria bacterium]KAF0160167.1 MAG: O-methyltransferase [Ignavibacteria bacterium]
MKVKNRLEFGNYFNELGFMGNGAEIGVQRGDFSAVIRNTWKSGSLYLIDRWIYDVDYYDVARLTYREQLNNYLYVVNRFAEDYSVKIFRMDSVEATIHFPDQFFDWIYIDADHSYAGCKRDLNAWYRKLKCGGFFCGHDYLDGIIPAGNFGVKSAVDEFVKDINANLYITEEEEWKSWYFVKPGVLNENIEEGLSSEIESKMVLITKAEKLIENGDYQNAKTLIDRILMQNPLDIDALNDLSVILILTQDFIEAEKRIQIVLGIDNTNEIALGNLKYLIEQKNNTEM